MNVARGAQVPVWLAVEGPRPTRYAFTLTSNYNSVYKLGCCFSVAANADDVEDCPR